MDRNNPPCELFPQSRNVFLLCLSKVIDVQPHALFRVFACVQLVGDRLEGLGGIGEFLIISSGHRHVQGVVGMHMFWDEQSELSNNRAEWAVWPFTVGRKNWLFSSTPKGAKASAVIYSIAETAKANGLRPFRYFQFLLERLPVGASANDCIPRNDVAQNLCRKLFGNFITFMYPMMSILSFYPLNSLVIFPQVITT